VKWYARKTRFSPKGFAAKVGEGDFVYQVHRGPSSHPTIGMPYFGLIKADSRQDALDQASELYLKGFDGKYYV